MVRSAEQVSAHYFIKSRLCDVFSWWHHTGLEEDLTSFLFRSFSLWQHKAWREIPKDREGKIKKCKNLANCQAVSSYWGTTSKLTRCTVVPWSTGSLFTRGITLLQLAAEITGSANFVGDDTHSGWWRQVKRNSADFWEEPDLNFESVMKPSDIWGVTMLVTSYLQVTSISGGHKVWTS